MDINKYWKKFNKGNEEDNTYIEAYHFCDSKKDADELVKLVLEGKKRATSSNYLDYENERLPKTGDLNIITDFSNEPKCIVETVNVEIIKFKDVNSEFAKAEGEGDLSLEFWRDAHRNFFVEEGKEFNEEMLVVCENFKVIYIN